MATRRQGTCVILNPAARAADPDQVRSLIGASAEIWTTSARGEAVELARRAVRDGFATVVAAGGDGTLNEVVNGLAPDRDGVVCGILPLGTGNDFARTVGIPRDPAEAWRVIEQRRVGSVDLASLERERDRRWFINMAVGGAIDQFHDKLTDDLKQH